MLSNFPPKLLVTKDRDINSLIMEDSNNLQTTRNDYSDITLCVGT